MIIPSDDCLWLIIIILQTGRAVSPDFALVAALKVEAEVELDTLPAAALDYQLLGGGGREARPDHVLGLTV